jgi:hypothetical protein
MLEVDIEKRLEDFTLRVVFRVDREVLVLFGPSGAGKSMTLNCVAGLARPDRGLIRLDGRSLFESDGRRRREVPLHQRRIGYVFQSYALFPHMTVAQNLAYGLRGRSDARARVEAMLARLRLTRKPGLVVLWGMALNPVCILQVCQHGNFDVLVGLWVALTLLMLLRFGDTQSETDWLCACLFLGLGVLTKTTPFILLPVLLAGTSGLSLRCRILGAVLALLPAALGLSILFALDPGGIWHKVVLYRSESGVFGISGILSIWGASGALALYGKVFPWVLLTLWASLVLRAPRWQEPAADRRMALSALLLIIIPALGPGYGPQYIYWFLPLLLILAVSPARGVRWMTRAFLITAAITYLVEYALNPVLGASLVAATGSDSLHQAGACLRMPASQTLLRLPLFAAYMGMILVLWRVSVTARGAAALHDSEGKP